MARKKSGLGKGLDALIPLKESIEGDSMTPSGGIIEIQLSKINPNPRQPRVRFDSSELTTLADSILEHGVIQPLIVSKDPLEDKYTLIAGERRLLAAKEAGLDAVPVIVRETTDQGRLVLALIENLQRTDLTPIEAAEAFHQLAYDFGLSHEEIGKRVGKSRVAVTNTLRLLNLPQSAQQAITDGLITEGHARALLSLQTPESQNAALGTIITKQLNVRQTEELVRKLSGERSIPKSKPKKSPEIIALEERLRSQLGTKVVCKHGRKGGSITIHYYSNEELDSLLDFLLGVG